MTFKPKMYQKHSQIKIRSSHNISWLFKSIITIPFIFNFTQADKVCEGWPFKGVNSGPQTHKGENYDKNNKILWDFTRYAYENCTHIYGNLVLYKLNATYYEDVPVVIGENENYNKNNTKIERRVKRRSLDYLKSIQEVYGYVYIDSVDVDEIPLNNLRIIKGSSATYDAGNDFRYSLYINPHAYSSPELIRLENIIKMALSKVTESGIKLGDDVVENLENWENLSEKTQKSIFTEAMLRTESFTTTASPPTEEQSKALQQMKAVQMALKFDLAFGSPKITDSSNNKLSNNLSNPAKGIKILLQNLVEIQNGSIYIDHSYIDEYLATIDWSQMYYRDILEFSDQCRESCRNQCMQKLNVKDLAKLEENFMREHLEAEDFIDMPAEEIERLLKEKKNTEIWVRFRECENKCRCSPEECAKANNNNTKKRRQGNYQQIEYNLCNIKFPTQMLVTSSKYCRSCKFNNKPIGCWDQDSCQIINKCDDPQGGLCSSARVYNLQARCVNNQNNQTHPYNKSHCCHEECAGGCYEPNNNKACFSCSNAKDIDDGSCIRQCRGTYRVQPGTGFILPIAEEAQRVRYNHLCVPKCPVNMVIQNANQGEICSRYCKEKEQSVIDYAQNKIKCNANIWDDKESGYGIAAPSEFHMVPKEFGKFQRSGFECTYQSDSPDSLSKGGAEFYTDQQVENNKCDMYNYYKDKKRIEGPIVLGSNSFKTFEMAPRTLKTFHNVEYISGYLKIVDNNNIFSQIQEKYKDKFGLTGSLKDLFPNLKEIAGLQLAKPITGSKKSFSLIPSNALYIHKLKGLKELGLNNLRSVFHGNIHITETENLCMQVNLQDIVRNEFRLESTNMMKFFKSTMNLAKVLVDEESKVSFPGKCNRDKNLQCHPLCLQNNGCFQFSNNRACLQCKYSTFIDLVTNEMECLEPDCSQANLFQRNETKRDVMERSRRSLIVTKNIQNTPKKSFDPLNSFPNSKIPNQCCETFKVGSFNTECEGPCEKYTYKDSSGYCHDCHQSCENCKNYSNVVSPSACLLCKSKTIISYEDARSLFELIKSQSKISDRSSVYNQTLLSDLKVSRNGSKFMCFDAGFECSSEFGLELVVPEIDELALLLPNFADIPNFSPENYTICRRKSLLKEIIIGLLIICIPVLTIFFYVMHKKYKYKGPKHAIIIQSSNLDLGIEIGSGFYGVVYKGIYSEDPRRLKTQMTVAIKLLKSLESDQLTSFISETNTWAMCEHENLVKLIGICLAEKPMLVSEFIDGGCLLDVIRKVGTVRETISYSNKNVLIWCMQIADGMLYGVGEIRLNFY